MKGGENVGSLMPIPKVNVPDYDVPLEFVDSFPANINDIYTTIMNGGIPIINGTNSGGTLYYAVIALNVDGGMVGIYGRDRSYYVGYCYPEDCLMYEATRRNTNPSKMLHNPVNSTGGYTISNYEQLLTLPPNLSPYSTRQELEEALSNYYSKLYPITYSYTNSVVSGPAEAAVGETVTVSATPDIGYGITDASTQILVTNNDVAVPYTWDATNQRITFTMPEGAVTVTVTASLIPTYPITYRPTRVTLDGPERAAVDSTVNVDCAFPEGYGVKTSDSITVTCNRVPVPFSWDAENQRITFTMPDPTA